MILRICLSLFVGVLLAGCASEDQVFARSVQKLTGTDPGATQSRARFETLVASGAPTLIAAVESSGQVSFLARSALRGGVGTWVTPDNVGLLLQGGFLAGTRGLGSDLVSADISQVQALVLARRAGQAQRFHTYLDGENQTVFRSYQCTVIPQGMRDITLPGGGAGRGYLMVETCAGQNNSFENSFWLHPQRGEVIQSRQFVSDATGALQIAQFSG